MFVVIIEWDGDKPPSTWYNRLHGLGLTVRGDKSKSVLDRRSTKMTADQQWAVVNDLRWRDDELHQALKAGADGFQDDAFAIVPQEGTVYCGSESLARALAILARELGAKSATYAQSEDLQSVTRTERDNIALDRISQTLGRRGRAPDPEDWTVTCYEEARTYTVDQVPDVVNCPHCHGFAIKTRLGKPKRMSSPIVLNVDRLVPGPDVYAAWKLTRFQSGSFEIPDIDSMAPAPSPLGYISAVELNKGLNVIDQNPAFISGLGNLDWLGAFKLLDSIFVSLVYLNKQRVLRSRLEAVTKYLSQGGDPSVRLVQKPGVIDALDAATAFGVASSVTAFRRMLATA